VPLGGVRRCELSSSWGVLGGSGASTSSGPQSCGTPKNRRLGPTRATTAAQTGAHLANALEQRQEAPKIHAVGGKQVLAGRRRCVNPSKGGPGEGVWPVARLQDQNFFSPATNICWRASCKVINAAPSGALFTPWEGLLVVRHCWQLNLANRWAGWWPEARDDAWQPADPFLVTNDGGRRDGE